MVAVNAGRPRTPLAKAQATGRDIINPARFKERKEPASRPLGKPSRNLTDLEKEAWEAFKSEVTWLTEADRSLVESASRMRALVWAGTGDQVKIIGRLLQLLNQMGATPAARTKVHAPQDEEADPSAEFFQ